MDMRLIIINQATIAGVSGSPSVRASGDAVSVRPDSGTENQVNINKRQDRAQLDTLEQTPLVDRSSISPAPVQSLLASSANQNQRGSNTFQTDGMLEQASTEVPQKNLVTADISESALRASSPSSVRSDEFQTCDELSDDSDENTSLLELETQILGRYQETPAPVSTQQASTLVVQAAASLDDPSAPEFSHIYHEILFNIHKRLCKAYGEGVQLAYRKAETHSGAQPVVGVSSMNSSSGGSDGSTSAGVDNPHASKKASKGLSNWFIEKLDLTPEKILKKPEALNKLAKNLTEMILGELRTAQPWPSSLADGVDGYVVDFGDDGDDGWVNGFIRPISTIVVHLTHQAFLDKVAWVDTGDGKKKTSEILASLIASILNLSDHPSAQTDVGGVLNDGILTVAQSGNKLFNEKMKAVRADSLRNMINQALISIMAEGIELTDENFDELLSRVKEVAINTLMNIRADIVRIFTKWSDKENDKVDSIKSRVVNSVAETLTSIVKEQAGKGAKAAIAIAAAPAAIKGKVSDAAGRLKRFFKSKPEPKPEPKSNKPDERPVNFTEQEIRKIINGEIEEIVQLFKDEKKFKSQIKGLIEKKLKEINPKIKKNLLELKEAAKACKESGGDVQDLVTRVTTTFGGGSQQPEGVDFLQGAVAASSTLEANGTSETLATSDQPDHRPATSSSEVMSEHRAEQTRVIDQVIAQESSKIVDEAIGLLIGELRKNLDTVIEKVKPGIGNVLEKAVNKGAAFIARRNEEDTAGLELPETIPGFTAAMTPVFTKLVVDIFSSKLESDEWERTTRTKVHKAVGKSNPPADPQRPSESAKFFDETLKTAEADALRQVADPLKSALDKLPFPSLQKLSSDFILQSTRDGTVWLDDLVRDVFNKKIDDETIVLTIIDTVSEEVVKLQHQLVIGATNWLKQRAKDWATKSQVDHCMNWLGKWITDNKEQIDLDAKAYVKALLDEVAPELEEAIHKRLETLRTAVTNGQRDKEGVVKVLEDAAEELDPEPAGDPELTGLAGVDAVRAEMGTDGEGQGAPDRWSTVRRALPGEGSRLARDMTGLVLGELRENLETVRSVMTPHINTVMTEVVNQGAAFVARHHGDTASPDTLPGFTQAVTPGMTTLVVDLFSRKLLSEVWQREITDDIGDTVEQALIPNGETEENDDGQSQEPSALGRVMDQALGAELADALRQGVGPLQSAMDELPFTSLQQLARDFILHSAGEGATWLDQRVSELFAQGEDEQSVVSTIVESITREVMSVQHQLVQGVAHWMQEEGPQVEGRDPHRQALVNLLSGRARSLLSPVVRDGAVQAGQEPGPFVGGVVLYLQQQLASGQTVERLAGYGVDWLSGWLGNHTGLIGQDVQQRVQAMLAQAMPELEASIHRRLATLREAAQRTRGENGSAVAFVQQAARDLNPEPAGDPELTGLAGVDAVRAEMGTDGEGQEGPDRWSTVRRALPGEGSRLARDMTGLVLGELRENLETVRSVMTPHINTVMTEVVNQGAAFVARHHGDTASPDTLPGFTQAVTPGMTTLVVDLFSRKLLSEVWQREITDDIGDTVEQALIPNGETEENDDGQSQEPSALGRVMDQALGAELADALRQGVGPLQSAMDELPFTSLQQLARDFILHSAGEGATWLDQRVSELFAQGEDEQSVVSTIVESITREVMSVQHQLVQGVAHWMQEEGPQVEGRDPHRQALVNLLSGRARSLLSPVVRDGAVQAGQEPGPFVGGVVLYLQQQLASGQTVERLAGYGVDWLSGWLGNHTGLIGQDVQQRVQAMLAQAMPELEASIHRRLATLREAAQRTRGENGSAVAFVQQAARDLNPEPAGDPELTGLAGVDAVRAEMGTDGEGQEGPDRWSTVRRALPGEGSRLARDMTGLVLGELRENLETVRSVMTPHINTVMTEVVNQGAAFVARHHGDTASPDTLPGFTQAVTPGMTTLVVDLFSRKLLSEVWQREITDDIGDTVEQALIPNGETEENDDGQSQEPSALGRVMDQALGAELADALRQGVGPLQSAMDELPFTSLQQLARDFILHSAGEGATWLDQRVSELFAQGEDEQSVVSTIVESITREVMSVQHQLVQGVAHWMQEEGPQVEGRDPHRQALVNLLSGRARSLLSPVVRDGAVQAGQEPGPFVGGGVLYLQQQLASGQTVERLAGYGVDWLSGWLGNHTGLIGQDVQQRVQAMLAQAMPELEASIHRRLATLREAAQRTRGENGSAVAFVQQAARDLNPEPAGDPELTGLAGVDAVRAEMGTDGEGQEGPDRWSTVRRALPGEGSRLARDMTGLVLGELRENLETVRSVMTPHINTVMTEVVNQGAAFVARHHGDTASPDTLPGFTQAVTPGMTTLVVDLFSRKLLSEVWQREITDDIGDTVEQALIPNGETEENDDGQSQEPSALGRVMDQALGAELADALRQGVGPLQSAMDELPFTSLQQLARDFILHSAGEGATWLDQRVSELFAQGEDEQSVVSTIVESITREVMSVQHQLVQGVAHWMQEEGPQVEGRDPHRQALVNLLSGRARSLLSPVVRDGAVQAGQEPGPFVGGVVLYLQQQLASGQTVERLAGYGVDWLSGWLGNHTGLIGQDVQQRVQAMLAQAMPELEASIHRRLATLREAAQRTRGENGSAVAFVQQAARDLNPEPAGDPELTGLAGVDAVRAEMGTDGEGQEGPDRWSTVRRALPGEGSRLARDMTGLVLGELRENLETVRSVMTPHINTVMTEVVNQGAAFVARHHGDTASPDTLPGFTQAVTPGMTTLVVDLFSRKLLSEVWQREITDDIGDTVEQALIPNGETEENDDGQSQEPSALGRVMDQALGAELADALRQGVGPLQSAMDELPFTSLQQLARDFILHSAGEGATWLDQRVSELFAQGEDEQSVVSTIVESITREVMSVQHQLVQGVAHWMQEEGPQVEGRDPHRQALVNLLSGRARSLLSPVVRDGAVQAGQEPGPFVGGVVLYLQQQLASGQTVERLAGYGVDWLSGWLGNHTGLIGQDVQQRVQAMLAQAMPELEASIHRRLATLREAAQRTRGENGSAVAFVQQAARDLNPEPAGDPELTGLAGVDAVRAEMGTDGEGQEGPDRWSTVRRALPGEGSRLARDMTGLVLGELRENLETVRSVMTPHINTVMTEVVNQGAAFVARHHGDTASPDTLPGFTQAVTPGMTTLVVDLFSRKLLSEVWQREITDDIGDTVEQALIPNGETEENDDGQSQEPSALGRVMDQALGAELADALRQGVGPLQSAMDELPFTSLQQLARDFILHSAGEGATWLDQRVSELFAQGEDEQSVVSTIVESITREVMSVQHQLVQGVAHWMQEEGPQVEGRDPHRQALVNLLSGRARSLLSPVVRDGAVQAGQEPGPFVGGVVLYLQQQLASGQTVERLAGYGVDWLSGWLGNHTGLIGQDVQQRVQAMLAQAMPELEASIHRRLATLREAAQRTRGENGSAVAFVQQAARDLNPEPAGDPELTGLAGVDAVRAEMGTDGEGQEGPDRWSTVRRALPGEGSRLARDMTGLVLGELRENLETVRSVMTPHINTVMTEVVNQGAAFVARHHGDTASPDTLPGFTQAVTPGMTTLVVDLFSRKLLSEVWQREITDDIGDTVEQALIPNGETEENDDGQSQEPSALGRVMDQALGAELADALRQGVGPLQSAMDELPFTSLQQLARDFILHSAGEGATWLDQRVSELFAQGEDEQSVVSTIVESITREVMSVQHQLVQGVAHWMQEEGPQVEGRDPHRQALVNLLSGRARSLLSPVVRDGAVQAGQEPGPFVGGVVLYLQQQLASGQTVERLAGYGVDWLSGWLGNHTGLIGQDVQQRVQAMLAQAMPELEASIHRRLATLREAAQRTRGENGSAVAFVQQAARDLNPEPAGDPELTGLAGVDAVRAEMGTDGEGQEGPDRWSTVRRALPGEGSRLARDMTGLVLGELRENLETVRSVMTPHINTVMTEVVNQGAAFVARHHGDTASPDTLPGFTQAVTPGMTTLVVDLFSRKLLSEVWQREITDDIGDTVEQALIPNGETEENDDGQSQEPSALGRVMDQALGAELADALRQGVGPLQSAMDELPFTSLQQLARDFILHSAGEGATWLDQRVSELFAQGEDEQSVVSTIVESITREVMSVQHQLVQGVAHWMQEEGPQVEGRDPHRQALVNLLSGRARSLLSPVVRDGAVQAGQEPGPFVGGVVLYLQQQLASGQTVERLAGYGVDWLSGWLGNHTGLIGQDVQQRVQAMLAQAMPELEASIHRRLATLREAAQRTRGENGSAVAFVQQAARDLNPEPAGDPELTGLAGVDAVRAEMGTDGEGQEGPDRWRRLCEAVVEQLGHGAGQLYDLTTKDVLDLREQGEPELAAGRVLLGSHIEAVIGDVVSEGAGFIAQRNAAQRNAAQQTDGQETDQQPAEGTTGLIEKLPPLLTTPAVNKVCETLLSAAMKEQLVGQVTQAAGQALTSDDKGKATVAASAAGPSAQGAVAKPHTAVGSAVDQVLRKELADLLRTGAGQLAVLLKTTPYETVKDMGRDLPLQMAGDGVEWLSELVRDLFSPEPGKVRSRVIESLIGQVVNAQEEVIDHVLDWLAAEPETGEGEPVAVANREKLLNLLVARLDPLVAPAVSGAVVEVARNTGQVADPEALSEAIAPFLSEQLDQGEVFRRLSGYGVDQLRTLVRKHREAIRQDVKTQARALMENVAKDLEGILDGHLDTLRAAVATGRQHPVDAVKAWLRVADELDKAPKGALGQASVSAVSSMENTAVNNKKQIPEHWRQLCQTAIEQLGNGFGDVIELTKQESPDLVARSLLTEHIGEVMEVAVKESAEFIAKHNGVRYGSSLVNGVVLPNGPIYKLTGVISPFLTKTVVESLSEKLLSAAWKKQTVCEVKKVTEKALFPERQDKVSSVTSKESQQTVKHKAFGQPIVIGSEADEILKKGLAEMLRDGANQLEAVLKSLPYDCVKKMASDLTLQGIADGTRWLDALAAGLFADNEVVVPRVINAITEQAVVTQQAVIDGVLGWLCTEDIKTKQKPNRQKLLDILVHRVGALVEPVVTGASSLVAESVMQTSEPRALRDAVLSFLQGQLNRGQVLERLAGYSVDQLSDWISQHREVISKDVEVNVRAMMQKVAPELESILHNRLAMLRSTMQQSLQNKSDVVATLRRAAEEIAPCQAMSAATKQNSKPEQSKATGVLPSLIPALSNGITAVITNGADIIRRKVWADNLRLKLGKYEDCSKMSIFPIVIPHVQRIVNEAISVGSDYGIRQLAEPSDGNPVRMTEAVKKHFQDLTAGYLGHIVADAIEGMADAVNKNAGDIQKSIEKALKSSGPSTDLPVLLTPHIHGAIDQILHEGRSLIQERISKWIEANASEATPELHKAIDKVLNHIMANGGEWITRHQNGIELEVIKPIQLEITETLKEAQAEIIQNVAVWLSNEANLNRLVATFTNEIREAVTNVVVATVAKQVSGKERGPEFRRAVNGITPYVTPIIDQALRQTITYTVKSLSDWVQNHGADISSLVNPLIDKTVQDVMPSVRQAVQDKALLLARNKAQDIDFNKLAAELAVAFVDHIDPDTLTSGALKVEPKSSVVRELPKILCFLMQTAETYECLGGNLMEPIKIDRVEIDGRVFKDIKAQLIRMADGSIRIRKMDLKFEDVDKIDIDIEIAGISISYQLPEKSKLYRAALLSSAPMMRPADLARSLFDAFVPERIDFNIDQITGEFHDDILDGPGEDTLGFGLSDIKLSLRLHKYYPKPYMDISVGPKDGHKTIESIKVKVAGQGVVDHIEADINVDRHRNGFADVSVLVDPGRLNRFAGWLIGGPIKVEAKAAINNGIGTLPDVGAINVHAPRFGGICNALIKNTIKAFNPGFRLGDDGKPVIKLKLTLFSEERSNPITRWLAKAANRILQFFTKPIEIRLSFKGAPYVPPEKGEKGVGSFNGIRFIDGLFNPCPLSIQSDTHEKLLRKLREISIDKSPQEHLECLREAISQVIEDFRLGNAPSDLSLVREIPLESLVLLVDYVKHNEGRQEDLARLLFLVASLVEALPEKAVELVNSSGFTPEADGQPYLLHLISSTPQNSWLANPKDGTVMERVYQDHQFKRLKECWMYSQSNPDGSIYRPGCVKEPVQEFTEKAVEKVRTLTREISIPDDIRLMMARDFDFAGKVFGIEPSGKQGLMVSSPVNQIPYYSQGVQPVRRIKDMGWTKHRFNVPGGIELSGGSTAPVA